MKISQYILIFLTIVLLGYVTLEATEFDLSLGKVNLHYRQKNPIKLDVRDGKQGITATRLSTERYMNLTEIGGSKFEFSQTALTEFYQLAANLEEGGLNSSTHWEDGELYVSAQGKNLSLSTSVSRDTGEELNSRQVEVLVQADAEGGILSVNHDESTVRLPSDEEEVSKKLRISNTEARNLLRDNGRSRVLGALKKAGRGNPNGANLLNNGGEEVAGGAGSVAGPDNGTVGINDLDPQSTFSFYLEGPNFQARIKNSILNLKLFYPGNGMQVTGVGANITVVGPVNGNHKNPKRVVLLDSISYDEDKGYYYYSFDDESWLLRLEPGGYDLFIDLGPSLTTKFGVTITKDGQVVEGRY